ncbi:hypothetical protein DFH07DRAFT_842761 [Mycena maculata]|uniref:Oxidase ustYa n=1 Tax=Mycena maculata TaxID=230809 RepID=A0AAD7I7E6_9AGAR|nr:hypothetical protein DFH07DRAFT_842761 [Mycena maculata]
MIVLHSRSIASTVAILGLLSVCLSWNIVRAVFRVCGKPAPALGTEEGNIPEMLPGTYSGLTEMMVEDTVRYRYPNIEASEEWESANPFGFGTYHWDDQLSLFVTVFHQHHCIETFGQQLTRTHKADWRHLQHCLNYMREMAMCHPDLTLERGDFTKRNFTTEHGGTLYVCRDLDPVYDLLKSNWREWVKFQKKSKGGKSSSPEFGHY